MRGVRSLVVAVVVLVLVPTSTAVAQQSAGPARFQQLVEINVEPGQETVFENYVKKLVEAANKAGARQTWTTYQVSIGKPGATYRIALSFRSWADRDAWATIPALLTQAFGQQEAERLMKEGGGAVERSVSEVWENLPNLASNPGGGPAGAPPAFVRVGVIRVQPAMAGAYEALLAKFKTAYEAQKLSVGRSILRVGPNNGSTYRRTQSFNKWSELDAMDNLQILRKHLGAQAFEKLTDELRRMTVFQQEFISARRADLSRTAPATSTQ